MSYLGLRAAIVSGIKAGVPALETCAAHGGRFDLTELKRYAAKAPAALIACLGGKTINTGGSISTALKWACIIVTKSTPTAGRDAQAMTIAEAITELIEGNRWGLTTTHNPDGIRAENLYSGGLDAKGVAVWGVTWDQANDHTPIVWADLDAFKQFCSEVDMAPPDGQIDIEGQLDLEQ